MVFRLKTSSERYPGPKALKSQQYPRKRASMKHTTPWRACEDDTVWRQVFKLIFEDLKAVSFEESNLFVNPIDLRIMPGTL